MKSLVLASALGTLAGTFAVPMIAGPIHFQITKPHSMFGWVPGGSTAGQTVSVTLGTVPGDFVLTDIAFGGAAVTELLVKANGSPVLCMPRNMIASYVDGQVHLATGILIPCGSSIVVDATTHVAIQAPVTLAGYLQ